MSATPVCGTVGCHRASVHVVVSMSGKVRHLCPSCYDHWWQVLFGRTG